MKKSTPLKETVVTTATPLASMPPPVIALEPEVTTEKEPTPEKAIEEEPEPQKAKATEAEPTPEKAKASEEEPVPEKGKATEETAVEPLAIIEVPEKATSSKAPEAAKSPTSEVIEKVVSDVRKAYPLPSIEFSDLLRMLEQAHKVSVSFRIY